MDAGWFDLDTAPGGEPRSRWREIVGLRLAALAPRGQAAESEADATLQRAPGMGNACPMFRGVPARAADARPRPPARISPARISS